MNIQAFLQPFIQNNTQEWAKTRQIFRDAGQDIDTLNGQISSKFRTMVTQDLLDLGKTQNTNLSGACEFMAKNGAFFADKMRFSTIMPDAYRILQSAP